MTKKRPAPASTFWQYPVTPLGWRAVGLTAAFSLMFVLYSSVFSRLAQDAEDGWWVQAALPLYLVLVMVCGLAAGATGLTALVRKKERAWLVWFSLLPALFLLLMGLRLLF